MQVRQSYEALRILFYLSIGKILYKRATKHSSGVKECTKNGLVLVSIGQVAYSWINRIVQNQTDWVSMASKRAGRKSRNTNQESYDNPREQVVRTIQAKHTWAGDCVVNRCHCPFNWHCLANHVAMDHFFFLADLDSAHRLVVSLKQI